MVLVLPGIDGRTLLSLNIALGLADGGVQSCIEIVDWTTGLLPLALYHLRSRRMHESGAREVAARIVEYRERYPGRPIHIIGYSGGGGVALYALDELPADRQVTSAILVGAAVSPGFDVRSLLAKTERGIWNYYSPLDCLFLGAVTSVFGTVDGKHTFSAGAVGFRKAGDELSEHPSAERGLHQCEFHPAMLRQFHLGGHFGWSNRVFVAEEIAPRIRATEIEFEKSAQ